jgi:hypothetical protein
MKTISIQSSYLHNLLTSYPLILISSYLHSFISVTSPYPHSPITTYNQGVYVER